MYVSYEVVYPGKTKKKRNFVLDPLEKIQAAANKQIKNENSRKYLFN